MSSDTMTYILERKEFVKSDELRKKYMEYGPTDCRRDILPISKGVAPKLLDENEKVRKLDLGQVKDYDTFMSERK